MRTVWGMVLFAAALLPPGGGYCGDNIFPAGTSVAVSRTPDGLYLVPNTGIEVQVTITNNEGEALRGVYYTEHIPYALAVETLEVSLDGAPVPDYLYEVSSDDIYTGTDVHRWIVEEPGRYAEMDNPLPPGGALTISYRITTAGYYELEWPPYFFVSERELPVSGYCFGYCDETFIINEDTDGDDMSDEWELRYFPDLSHDGAADGDDDGLADYNECQLGTDPTLPDTDGDGLSDYVEMRSGSSPIDQNSLPALILINFQPSGALCPSGFCPNDTSSYSQRGYGWQ